SLDRPETGSIRSRSARTSDASLFVFGSVELLGPGDVAIGPSGSRLTRSLLHRCALRSPRDKSLSPRIPHSILLVRRRPNLQKRCQKGEQANGTPFVVEWTRPHEQIPGSMGALATQSHGARDCVYKVVVITVALGRLSSVKRSFVLG